MEAFCTPMLATAALFTSLLFLDLFRQEYNLLAGHAIFGVLATLMMMLLCQKGATLAAWGLLAFPFVLLILGWAVGVLKGENAAMVPYRPANPPNPCGRCQKKPCNCGTWLGPGGTRQSSGGGGGGSLLGPGGTRQLFGPGGTQQDY